jgi:hypothetical protein
MVDVVVVGGNWDNYQDLAVDPRWSQYFNASGLIKEQIRNFANDRNITLLGYYEGLSLIPYFRDENGRNIFIETVINRDTDRTGLFCAFNNDLVEEDYYTGKVDLLGNTIVGRNETNINFLSYKELIAESISVTQTPLDLPGNVTGILSGSFSYDGQESHAFGGDINGDVSTSGLIENYERTAWFAEGSVYRVNEDNFTSSTASISVDYVIGSEAFTVIGNTYIPLEEGTVSLSISASDYAANPSGTASYVATFILNNQGEILKVATLTPGVNPVVSPSDIVLGYVTFDITPIGEIDDAVMIPVTVDTNGFVDLELGTDFVIDYLGNGQIEIEFLATATQQVVSNYESYRKFKTFNRLVSLLDSTSIRRFAMNLGPDLDYKKVSMVNMSISDIETSQFQNKSFILNTGLETTDLVDVVDGYFVFYTLDNEFILGSNDIVTKEDMATATQGVVARHSIFYSRYFDGIINTRDFFWSNRLWVDNGNDTNALLGETVDITFIDGEDAVGVTSSFYNDFAGNDYIVFRSDNNAFDLETNFQLFEKLVFPGSNLNQGSFQIVNSGANLGGPSGLANALGFVSNVFANEY